MSEVGREDWWTMPLEDLAKELWGLSLNPTAAQRRVETVSTLMQARDVLQASDDTKHLVWATWALVGVTAVLALMAALA